MDDVLKEAKPDPDVLRAERYPGLNGAQELIEGVKITQQDLPADSLTGSQACMFVKLLLATKKFNRFIQDPQYRGAELLKEARNVQ